MFDKKTAVRVANTTKTTYSIERDKQIAAFFVFTAERAKIVKPVEMAILSFIPESDPDLIVCLNEPLRPSKPEQQSNTIWFPTPGNPGKIEDHTPIQTRIIEELYKLKEKQTESKR